MLKRGGGWGCTQAGALNDRNQTHMNLLDSLVLSGVLPVPAGGRQAYVDIPVTREM